MEKTPLAIAFAAGGLLHLALDFPLHTHDARMHFWPVSNWAFESPVSYWDNAAHAGIVGPIEATMSLGAAIILWRRPLSKWLYALVAVLLAGELLSSGVWRFVF